MVDINSEEQLKERIMEVAVKGVEIIKGYFDGKKVDPGKVPVAIKVVNQANKIMEMDQKKVLTERAQAIKVIPWLSNDSAREQYIRLMNPEVQPPLLKEPKKRPKKE